MTLSIPELIKEIYFTLFLAQYIFSFRVFVFLYFYFSLLKKKQKKNNRLSMSETHFNYIRCYDNFQSKNK